MPSEHQLCERFSVSRVTVRLALGDLQHRGLIYRHHGKGTFVHANAQQTRKPFAILMRSSRVTPGSFFSQFLSGFQSHLDAQGSYGIITSQPPTQWSPSLATVLGGVLVVQEGAVESDLDSLRKRALPYLLIGWGDSQKSAVRSGLESAVYEAVLTLASRGRKRFAIFHESGNPEDVIRIRATLRALKEAGLDASSFEERVNLPVFSTLREAAGELLSQQQPPEVILTSGSLAAAALTEAVSQLSQESQARTAVLVTTDSETAPVAADSCSILSTMGFENGRLTAEAMLKATITANPVELPSLPYKISWASTL